MSRLFTENHRKKHHVASTDPKYHGAECEAIYLNGMELLKEHHYLRAVLTHINIVASSSSITNKTTRKTRNAWVKAVAALADEPRSRATLIARYNDVAELLKDARHSYSEYHSERHGVPILYHVVDPRMQVLVKCHTHGYARHYIDSTGIIAKLKYIKV